jgi:quercetin dioxygenase-like cupin family protein
MATTTFIDTNKLPRQPTSQGEVTEILNNALAGAENVVGMLRWLEPGQRLEAAAAGKHQLIYLMEGSGRITLEGQEHDVTKGMGVYLGPSESASVQATTGTLKLFHLIVEQIPA